ncbi:MAG: DoxX family protein [Actinobacteria bacterium]|nr:DoxX family protein [Actinomycetota bacterium]
MDVTNVILSVLLALVCVGSAVADFKLMPQIVESMQRLRMPTRVIPALGIAKVAGALGLVVGFSNGALGSYAALCLSLYFFLATALHLRAHDTLANTAPAAVLLVVAVLTFVTSL